MNTTSRLVVTGISGDLGSVIAKNFARDPCTRIIGTMRRHKKSSDIFPSNVTVIDNCDLTKEPDCERLSAEASQFDGPFGFVHSVGTFFGHKPFLSHKVSDAVDEFSSHVTTFYCALKYLIPAMKTHGEGSCIAFSCNSVQHNYPNMAAFTASKSAVESIVKSMANEFSGDGLRFNALVLASLKTAKEHQAKPHGDFENYIPPEDVVPIVEFLLSRKSYLMNGNAIKLFRHSKSFFGSSFFDRIAE